MSGGKVCPKCNQFFGWSEFYSHTPVCGEFNRYLVTDENKLRQLQDEKAQKLLQEVRSAIPTGINESTHQATPLEQARKEYNPPAPTPTPVVQQTGLEQARQKFDHKDLSKNEEYQRELKKLEEMLELGFIQDHDFQQRKQELTNKF